MKKFKGLSIIKMATMAILFLAVLMNVQLSYKTFVDTKPVVVRADDDDGEFGRKKGPLQWFPCTYTDNSSTSISVSITGGSYSHNSGVTKAGYKAVCQKSNQSDCYNVDCGPHTPPSGS